MPGSIPTKAVFVTVPSVWCHCIRFWEGNKSCGCLSLCVFIPSLQPCLTIDLLEEGNFVYIKANKDCSTALSQSLSAAVTSCRESSGLGVSRDKALHTLQLGLLRFLGSGLSLNGKVSTLSSQINKLAVNRAICEQLCVICLLP